MILATKRAMITEVLVPEYKQVVGIELLTRCRLIQNLNMY